MEDHASHTGEDSRRTFLRLQVGIGARLETLSGSQAVRLIDLSQGGACVILSRPEEAGAGVLTWLGFEAFGDLAWTGDGQVGIEFEQPLPIACLVATRRLAPSVVREEEMGTSMARAWVSGEMSDR